MKTEIIKSIERIAKDEVFKRVAVGNEIYENYYISNYRRLYSLNSGRLLKPKIKQDNRIEYRLNKNGKKKYLLAHRLVAFAFVENPDPANLKIINHIDENPQNNKWDNLEWSNDKLNLNYKTTQKRRALTRSKRIRQFDENGFFIAEYVSMNEASRQTRICLKAIFYDRKNGTMKTGYYWKYVEDDV